MNAEILAYESALCERSSLTGKLLPPGAHLDLDSFNNTIDEYQEPESESYNNQEEKTLRSSRLNPLHIALFIIPLIAVVIIAYMNFHSTSENDTANAVKP